MYNSYEITLLFIELGILLASARLLGEIFIRFNQPAVVGEILAGVILGPSILGSIAPEWNALLFPNIGSRSIFLDGFTTVAIALFLLVAGLEVDLSTIWRQGKSVLIIGVLGIIIPFTVAFLPAIFSPAFFGGGIYSDRLLFALFFATALSISALPVIAKILMDLNIYRTDLGMVIIAASTFEDLLGGIMFAFILGLSGTTTGHGFGIMQTLVMTAAFAFILLTLGRVILHKILPWIQAHSSWPGGVLGFALSISLFAAAFTEWIGVHAIFGAFLMGIAIGDSSHLREHTRKIINQFISSIFAPIFFASIGLKINFFENFDIYLVLVVLLIACIGKIVGCGVGARIGGLPIKEAWAVGFGLNARGAIEIVFGLLALQYGLINQRMFVALVVMALVTSIMSGPLIQFVLKHKKSRRFIDFTSSRAFIKSLTSENKKDVIKELSSYLANITYLNAEEIDSAVWERELTMSTGIGNFVAVPHARVGELKAPIIAVGLSNTGIDFDSPDGEAAKIIFLILTPTHDDGIQLEILADIAGYFKDVEFADKVLKVNNYTEFKALMMIGN